MPGALHILVICTLSCVAAAVNLYIEAPVKLLDCRSSRQDDQWTIGSTEATTKITEKPADPSKLYDVIRNGDLQYIENELSRLGASSLFLDWQNPMNRGRTALHIAAEQDKPSIVAALLTAGANPNIQDDYYGWTPVYIAARHNKIDVLRLLLDPKYQADVNLADYDGMTPVYRASREGHVAALELLLAQGRADPDTVNNVGNSPLMQASGRGHLACVRALLAAGGHVNLVRPSSGEAALHWAAWNNEPDVAQLLLEAGANKEAEDNSGRTPAAMARRMGYGSVVDVINNY